MTDMERDAVQRDIGRLEARADALESELREIKGDVKAILALVNQAKGGWKTLVVVGARGRRHGRARRQARISRRPAAALTAPRGRPQSD